MQDARTEVIQAADELKKLGHKIRRVLACSLWGQNVFTVPEEKSGGGRFGFC